jgi:inosine/xanthosine triphosphatase
MRVAIGSVNPVKIISVQSACSQLWPEEKWRFEPIAAPSGVSAQPLSDEEARTGARARAAYAQGCLDADFGVGIEGGLQKVDGYWFNLAWIVVVDRFGSEGVSSTTSVAVPDGLLPLIEAGHELRDACEILWGLSRTGYQGGLIGLLTDETLDRTGVYIDAVVAALTRFRHPEAFGAQR